MLRSILGVVLSIINNNNLTYWVGLSKKKLALLVLEKYKFGATDGILPNPFNIYKVLYFKEFIDVNMNIVVT